MRTAIAIIATTLALSATARDALAQRPQTRQGVNVSFGLGGGSAGIRCDGCTRGREGGNLFYLNIGGTITPRLTIGGELNGFGRTSNEEDLTIAAVMAVGHFYPRATSGFFVTTGVGLTNTLIENRLDRTSVTASGFGVEAGLGYDVRLGRNFSLSPYAQYVTSFSNQVMYSGVAAPGRINADYVHIGLGFTWH